MHYQDETRRYNLLSGLLLGSVLGAGLGLLAPPTGAMMRRRRSRPLRERVAARGSELREMLADSWAAAVSAGRRQLHR